MDFTPDELRAVADLDRGVLKVTGEDRVTSKPVPDGLLDRLVDLGLLTHTSTHRGAEWKLSVPHDEFLIKVDGTRSVSADAVERERDALALVALLHTGHVDFWDLTDDERTLHAEGYALLDVLAAARRAALAGTSR